MFHQSGTGWENRKLDPARAPSLPGSLLAFCWPTSREGPLGPQAWQLPAVYTHCPILTATRTLGFPAHTPDACVLGLLHDFLENGINCKHEKNQEISHENQTVSFSWKSDGLEALGPQLLVAPVSQGVGGAQGEVLSCGPGPTLRFTIFITCSCQQVPQSGPPAVYTMKQLLF